MITKIHDIKELLVRGRVEPDAVFPRGRVSFQRTQNMPTVNEDIYYLSNCKRRQHARMYGVGAFYDLDVERHQANLATDISKGQKCVVATPTKKNGNEIALECFVLSRIVIKRDDERDVLCRVFFGKRINQETLSKADAARHRFITSSLTKTAALSTDILCFGQNDFSCKMLIYVQT